MSDLAKKCAHEFRDKNEMAFPPSNVPWEALAAFIEAAQACRNDLDDYRVATDTAAAYDAALRNLAQSMEVE